MSLNPLKGTATFSRTGLDWFAQQIFLEALPTKRQGIRDELKRMADEYDLFLMESELVKPFNIHDPNDGDQIVKRLVEHKDSAEWWAHLAGFFSSFALEAMDNNDAEFCTWATACAERCRSMFVFKRELEDVVWVGQSARRIVNILSKWDTDKDNDNEEKWQQLFKENSFALSQVLAVPLIFIQDKAFVGGMSIERTDARYVDYLFSAGSSREAVLVEIKTPTTKLMGKEYRRNAFQTSGELSGAIVQLLDYKSTLMQNSSHLANGKGYELSVFNPRCVLIIGNAQKEFVNNPVQRRSFELFRGSLRDVEIITYDELFRKLEILAELFNLTRKQDSSNTK